MDIQGKIAIVTGAGSGLGAATAQTLHAQGAELWLVDRDETALDGLKIARAHKIAADVGDAGQVEAAFNDAAQSFGSPSILVNCAGIAPAKKISGRDGVMPLDDFEQVIRVNLVGSFNCLRLAAHMMRDNAPNEDGERGVIINTSSVAAFDGQIGQTAYAASKGGIAALTLPAARELAVHGIRVAAIAPGLFGTPLLLNMPEPVQASLAATIPFPQRFGRAEEFAELVTSIVRNPMLNGEVIRLDGALRMAPR